MANIDLTTYRKIAGGVGLWAIFDDPSQDDDDDGPHFYGPGGSVI